MAWCGVDIFFVLSGYLIGGIILDNRGSSNFYAAFYSRRTARIFPAYFLLLILAFFPTGPFGIDADPGSIPFLAYATFTANFLTAQALQPAYWLGPLWSICIEEQFYLLAPLLLRSVPARLIPWALGWVILGSAALRSAWSLELVQHSMSPWDFTLTRLDGLGLGVFTAWLVRHGEFVSQARRYQNGLKWLLVALMGVCVWLSQQSDAVLLGPGILCISLTTSVTILVTTLDPSSRTAETMRSSPLVYLGKYSYFLYLFHMPLFWLSYLVLVPHDSTAPFVTATALLVLGLLAPMSWRYFERPILRIGRRVTYRPPRHEQPLPCAASCADEECPESIQISEVSTSPNSIQSPASSPDT
jgi:peptidoglycan/LPS O-acetylase OafA/YrhL